MNIPRTDTDCWACKHNDGEYESLTCRNCHQNPWLKNNFEDNGKGAE